uniref:Uncharacterized protein n=1 Tax=Lactuca sativa TaxID=4236 RepID=A0A9R1UVL7_LACSA|nr:hypothetical protein LSAT_V11C800447010 [Lactuca sativa]
MIAEKNGPLGRNYWRYQKKECFNAQRSSNNEMNFEANDTYWLECSFKKVTIVQRLMCKYIEHALMQLRYTWSLNIEIVKIVTTVLSNGGLPLGSPIFRCGWELT